MSYSEKDIYNAAIQKVAEIFGLLKTEILPNYEFGKELCNSHRTDFKENEYDRVLFNIRYVSDRKTTKELNSGSLVIRTVGDFCDHMIHCYQAEPKRVINTLLVDK